MHLLQFLAARLLHAAHLLGQLRLLVVGLQRLLADEELDRGERAVQRCLGRLAAQLELWRARNAGVGIV